MDRPCSICGEIINIIFTQERHIEYGEGIACMECVWEAKKRMLNRELKDMKREGVMAHLPEKLEKEE